ncbi:carboxypeptidase-like regulatory domain-containing protein [Yeosuana sp. MJ-SS3]|uniref:Carboxypeptidase-like regulatory domain-containing protein n=1 Tax=Gilvirhabdus luticola TaxID=3079858 RepID=A0ABU3U546_9FLAO|nr:carboxypeptidase-like regulatory domain-containing protein [Yeosuana sp. MJ-SS3]MDU8885533.1 carboxypeptidase-like regulatory domain-containing protein [Yeosuana sp. MJ-SS3]
MKNIYLKTQVRRLLPLLIFFFVVGINQNIEAFQNNNQQDTFTEFKGLVVDSRNNDPLIYADLNVNGTNIRSITNTEGEFSLKVPKEHLEKSVTVSFLGYRTQTVSLSEFNRESTVIKLSVVATKLTEINISTVKDPKKLFQEVLKRKAENYYGNESLMTAFYRESIKKGKKNASLSEAVLEIYKNPTKSLKKDNLILIKSRKNTNYSRLDTLALKLQGGPFSTLYTDLMKYPEYVFTDENMEYYEFSFDGRSQIDNRQVYVLSFKQKPNVLSPFYFGKLYVDVTSLALLRADYQLNVSNRAMTGAMFVKKKPKKVRAYPLEASYRVDYREKDGKWQYGYSNIKLVFRVKWKGRLFNSTYSLDSEMLITDWQQNTAGIKPQQTLKPNVILTDEASGFTDPEFWGEYNIIEPEKSIETAIKKISRQLEKLKS